MKNKQIDLNDHLFAQIERLSEDGITQDKLTFELERAKGLTIIASQIIANQKLALEAQTLLNDGSIHEKPSMMPKFIGLTNGKQVHS